MKVLKLLSRLIGVSIGILLMVSCSNREQLLFVESPNGENVLTFQVENGRAYYSVSKKDNEVIDKSLLGFQIANQQDLFDNFVIESFSISSNDTTWEQVWGEQQYVHNQYNELKITLGETLEDSRQLVLVFRMFDDGLGFRYVFPEQVNLNKFQILNELTEFNLAHDADGWGKKAYQPDRYEYLYKKQRVSLLKDTVHTPFTMKSKGGLHLSIHEATLTDYASMTLFRSNETKLNCDLVPWSDGVKVYAQIPFKTPWRTIQIAETAADLISSTMILNLNEPCKLDSTDWVEPAKYIGIWWEMHLGKSTWGQGPNHGATTENTKKYMNFAAEHGFNGVLVEGWNYGWDSNWWENGNDFKFTKPYPDFDIEEITRYGKEKGVDLIGHHETGAAVINYESQLEDAMAYYNKHGVRYIKTGYVNPNGVDHKEWHHGQYMVRHYRNVVEEAAKNNIMLCVHEPIKPTGIRRTYPNMMSREGARGMEFNAWGPDGGNPPNHETILPFTRLLGGPMDFTPGIFELSLEGRENNQVNTTLAKQLALYVVLYSPLHMAADLPENYVGQPAFQFIKDVPVDWSETCVVNGEIGEYVTIARKDRNSDNWFLGSITNEEPRVMEIDLSFLDNNCTYQAIIYADEDDAHYVDNPKALVIQKREVNANDQLKLILAAGGGQAISFVKIK